MQREHPARIESLKFITSAKVNRTFIFAIALESVHNISISLAPLFMLVQVPIISCFLDGIDIDIGFAQTNLNTLDSGDA